MNIIQKLKQFRTLRYPTLNKVVILEKNLLHNLQLLQNIQPQATIIPVLKSNAYGHGLAQISKILGRTNVPMIAVDSFPEAQVVYDFSPLRVLVIGETSLETYRYFDARRTEFCVYNLTTLRYLASLKKKVKVHLFLDTGMHREGIQNLEDFLREENILKNVEIVGLCSHLASAELDSDLNREQEQKFFHNLDILHRHRIYPRWVHLGNSAGVFALSDKRLTAFRAGFAFYGYNPFEPNHPTFSQAQQLRPALHVISHIVSVQRVRKGETVSYDETFRAERDTTIATVPFGYAEGLDRRLSNVGTCYIGPQKSIPVQIAGRVCMNLTCLDVGDNPVQVGDEVEVISEQRERENSVERIAQKIGTIPYEVLVRLNGNIRRVVV